VIPGARRHRYTYADYLALEDDSTVRHEFYDGEIYAMAGGTPTHAALAGAIIRMIGGALREGCRVYTSDLRIRVPETGLSTYPDAAVVCGPTVRAADDRLAVTDPVLLVDVTSRSTEDYDRGEKLAHYERLPSVEEVLIASHRRPELVLRRRSPDGPWTSLEARSGETLELRSIAIGVPVDAIYRDGLEDDPEQSEPPLVAWAAGSSRRDSFGRCWRPSDAPRSYAPALRSAWLTASSCVLPFCLARRYSRSRTTSSSNGTADVVAGRRSTSRYSDSSRSRNRWASSTPVSVVVSCVSFAAHAG
jgi:Uma2 family endonuclease